MSYGNTKKVCPWEIQQHFFTKIGIVYSIFNLHTVKQQ